LPILLTRQERENLVLDLYFNQNKNTREISQEAKISFREIGTILDKARKEKEESKEQTEKQSLSTQAYKLFSEGKTPTQVAIALNIRQPEVTELQNEYWKLNQLYILNQIYQETRGNLHFFLELYRQSNAASMNVQNVINLLRIANNDISSVEYRCQQLRKEAASLEARNRNAARTLQQLSDMISETQKTLDHYSLLCKQQRSQIDKLYLKKTQLEEFIECFKSNNKYYVKIKEDIKQEVENTLANLKQLLRQALLALIESLRMDPSKFQLLYYQMSTETTTTTPTAPSPISTPAYSSQNCPGFYIGEQYLSQDYNNPTEAFENFVLNEAEKLYGKLLEDSIDKTISNLPSDILPNVQSSSVLRRTEPFDIKNNHSNKIASYTYRKEEEEHTFVESEN